MKARIFRKYRDFVGKMDKARIKRHHPGLWDMIHGYRRLGVSYSDFLVLYETVRALKPAEVLECGTGSSTIAIALALRDNEKRGGG